MIDYLNNSSIIFESMKIITEQILEPLPILGTVRIVRFPDGELKDRKGICIGRIPVVHYYRKPWYEKSDVWAFVVKRLVPFSIERLAKNQVEAEAIMMEIYREVVDQFNVTD